MNTQTKDSNTQGPEETPVIEHLHELKRRLIISIIAVLIGFGISYYFINDIYGFLVEPLAKALSGDSITGEPRKMIYTGLTEAFFTYLKLSLFSGFILAFPVIAFQIYVFCAPGLYAHEKKFFIPFIIISPALFIAGGAFVYYFLFPLAWEFFLSFEMPGGEGVLPIQLEAKISEYLSLVTSLIMAFGVTFQLPLVIVLLVKIGVVTVAQLKAFRKYAVVIIVTVAAFITPPDALSQIMLATPLYLLYEISIIFCSAISKKNNSNLENRENITNPEQVNNNA